MVEWETLRGKVTAYPEGEQKGLVEVSVGAYDKERDKIFARVKQSMTGVYWLPEIGDVVEVEVPSRPGYEARIIHIHRPAGDEQTKVCWTQKNEIKQLKTQSGHTVTLDDTQDKTALTLHTAGGLELKMEDEKRTVTVKAADAEQPVLLLDMEKDEITLSAGKKICIQCGGAKIEIDKSGNITIAAKGKLDVSAQEISVAAKGKLTAKGQQVDVSGAMTAKFSGKSQLELSSSGVTQVKGSMVKLN